MCLILLHLPSFLLEIRVNFETFLLSRNVDWFSLGWSKKNINGWLKKPHFPAPPTLNIFVGGKLHNPLDPRLSTDKKVRENDLAFWVNYRRHLGESVIGVFQKSRNIRGYPLMYMYLSTTFVLLFVQFEIFLMWLNLRRYFHKVSSKRN